MEPRATELHLSLVAWAKERGWKGRSRTRVPIDDVRRIFTRQPRHGEGYDTQRAELAALLITLTSAGLLTPLQDTDREKIPLPVKVWLEPVVEPEIPQQAEMPRWHPSLRKLARHWPNANPYLRECFTVLNAWAWSFPDLAPLHQRERALDIFGRFGSEETFAVPEKTFDVLRKKPFFRDREHLWGIVHVEPDGPPLLGERVLEEIAPNHFRRVGSGGVLLVLENSATYSSILATLPAEHDLGYLAWGLGSMFIASVRSLSDRHNITDIRYFGDLDLTGLDIPRLAEASAKGRGLPSVRPAVELYSMLFEFGLDKPSADRSASSERALRLASWLPLKHQGRAIALLTGKRRIAQEWVSRRRLTERTTWYSDLRQPTKE
jgi:hypothetical protein